jgi:hypothetical protein
MAGMDALRRWFRGGDRAEPASATVNDERVGQEPRASADDQAIQRYRYLLRTAPPETIEEAHAEAFAQLSPQQRRMVLDELSSELSEHERAAGVSYEDDPRSLARLATRTEMRRPGTLERSFDRMGGRGVGPGGLMAGSFFSAFAGILIGSAIAEQFFGDADDDQGSSSEDSDTAQGDADADADVGDGGGYDGGDLGGGDFGGGDFGGSF